MNKMKVCVSGWYFYPNLYQMVFNRIKKDFEICVVTYFKRAQNERPRDYDQIPASEQISLLKNCVSYHFKIPVAGLEFGGYDWYIKNIWDGESPVLFMHDDVLAVPEVFYDMERQMEEQEVDQAFIFRDEKEEIANGRKHGRGIYCSARFIQFMLDYTCTCAHSYDHEHPHHPGQNPKVMLKGVGHHNGFFYDKFNMGEHTSGPVPNHCRHYNEGIYHFAAFAGRCARKDGKWPGFNSGLRVYFPDFNSGRRGMWKGKIYGRERSEIQ